MKRTSIKNLLILVFIITTFAIIYAYYRQQNPITEPQIIEKQPNIKGNPDKPYEVLLTNLNIPWEIVFLDNESFLITERPGNVKIFKKEHLNNDYKLKNVFHFGEGGLLGAEKHPNFSQNKYLYFYFTYREGVKILNKVERYKLNENTLEFDKVIIDQIPGAIYHDGGRIKFGPDNYLYITTGDAGNANSAQDINQLSGKILRLTDNGAIPKDNPFNNATYSYGHRNPQGLAWDKNNQLWITEHGPSGVQSGFDEINKIIKGGNYGWPITKGDESYKDFIKPFIQSGEKDTWAPSGAVIVDEYLLFAGLRGSAIYKLNLNNRKLTEHFKNQFGRIRTISLDPEGRLYILTSNRDGRGEPQEDDDKLIRLNKDYLLYN
ncbi:MAG: glucose sorbosone dehydrogenase [Patescibacteria group bacterium]|nr:MAG: glucose sorbosone dehydrogenase [Patescibacteria group bacterium]